MLKTKKNSTPWPAQFLLGSILVFGGSSAAMVWFGDQRELPLKVQVARPYSIAIIENAKLSSATAFGLTPLEIKMPSVAPFVTAISLKPTFSGAHRPPEKPRNVVSEQIINPTPIVGRTPTVKAPNNSPVAPGRLDANAKSIPTSQDLTLDPPSPKRTIADSPDLRKGSESPPAHKSTALPPPAAPFSGFQPLSITPSAGPLEIPSVVLVTGDKAWVRLDAKSTQIFKKGEVVPGLGVFMGQDKKGAKFDTGIVPLSSN
jgi:hypothetical protein